MAYTSLMLPTLQLQLAPEGAHRGKARDTWEELDSPISIKVEARIEDTVELYIHISHIHFPSVPGFINR